LPLSLSSSSSSVPQSDAAYEGGGGELSTAASAPDPKRVRVAGGSRTSDDDAPPVSAASASIRGREGARGGPGIGAGTGAVAGAAGSGLYGSSVSAAPVAHNSSSSGISYGKAAAAAVAEAALARRAGVFGNGLRQGGIIGSSGPGAPSSSGAAGDTAGPSTAGKSSALGLTAPSLAAFLPPAAKFDPSPNASRQTPLSAALRARGSRGNVRWPLSLRMQSLVWIKKSRATSTKQTPAQSRAAVASRPSPQSLLSPLLVLVDAAREFEARKVCARGRRRGLGVLESALVRACGLATS
jgi:hypothetical protein